MLTIFPFLFVYGSFLLLVIDVYRNLQMFPYNGAHQQPALGVQISSIPNTLNVPEHTSAPFDVSDALANVQFLANAPQTPATGPSQLHPSQHRTSQGNIMQSVNAAAGASHSAAIQRQSLPQSIQQQQTRDFFGELEKAFGGNVPQQNTAEEGDDVLDNALAMVMAPQPASQPQQTPLAANVSMQTQHPKPILQTWQPNPTSNVVNKQSSQMQQSHLTVEQHHQQMRQREHLLRQTQLLKQQQQLHQQQLHQHQMEQHRLQRIHQQQMHLHQQQLQHQQRAQPSHSRQQHLLPQQSQPKHIAPGQLNPAVIMPPHSHSVSGYAVGSAGAATVSGQLSQGSAANVTLNQANLSMISPVSAASGPKQKSTRKQQQRRPRSKSQTKTPPGKSSSGFSSLLPGPPRHDLSLSHVSHVSQPTPQSAQPQVSSTLQGASLYSSQHLGYQPSSKQLQQSPHQQLRQSPQERLDSARLTQQQHGNILPLFTLQPSSASAPLNQANPGVSFPRSQAPQASQQVAPHMQLQRMQQMQRDQGISVSVNPPNLQQGQANQRYLGNPALAKFNASTLQRVMQTTSDPKIYAAMKEQLDILRRNAAVAGSQPHIQSQGQATGQGDVQGLTGNVLPLHQVQTHPQARSMAVGAPQVTASQASLVQQHQFMQKQQQMQQQMQLRNQVQLAQNQRQKAVPGFAQGTALAQSVPLSQKPQSMNPLPSPMQHQVQAQLQSQRMQRQMQARPQSSHPSNVPNVVPQDSVGDVQAENNISGRSSSQRDLSMESRRPRQSPKGTKRTGPVGLVNGVPGVSNSIHGLGNRSSPLPQTAPQSSSINPVAMESSNFVPLREAPGAPLVQNRRPLTRNKEADPGSQATHAAATRVAQIAAIRAANARRAMESKRVEAENKRLAHEAELREIAVQKKRRLEAAPWNDYQRVLTPNYGTPFTGAVDAWQRLLPYHVLLSQDELSISQQDWDKEIQKLSDRYKGCFRNLKASWSRLFDRMFEVVEVEDSTIVPNVLTVDDSIAMENVLLKDFYDSARKEAMIASRKAAEIEARKAAEYARLHAKQMEAQKVMDKRRADAETMMRESAIRMEQERRERNSASMNRNMPVNLGVGGILNIDDQVGQRTEDALARGVESGSGGAGGQMKVTESVEISNTGTQGTGTDKNGSSERSGIMKGYAENARMGSSGGLLHSSQNVDRYAGEARRMSSLSAVLGGPHLQQKERLNQFVIQQSQLRPLEQQAQLHRRMAEAQMQVGQQVGLHGRLPLQAAPEGVHGKALSEQPLCTERDTVTRGSQGIEGFMRQEGGHSGMAYASCSNGLSNASGVGEIEKIGMMKRGEIDGDMGRRYEEIGRLPGVDAMSHARNSILGLNCQQVGLVEHDPGVRSNDVLGPTQRMSSAVGVPQGSRGSLGPVKNGGEEEAEKDNGGKDVRRMGMGSLLNSDGG